MVEQSSLQEYWERRLSKRLDLTTVGHSGLGGVFNGWLYRARDRALRRGLKAASIVASGVDMLEIGTGSGAWIPFWLAQGVHHLTGVDITLVSVTTLGKQYPRLDFVQCDIGQPAPLAGSFDLITAFDTLFHITDDTAFSCAIANIASLLKPGGTAIISDSFCSDPFGPFATEYHRTRAHYLSELALNQLEPVHIEPIFFAMTTTLCKNTTSLRRLSKITARLLWVVQRLAQRKQTEWLNHLIGGSLYGIDGVLGSALDNGPSLSLLFVRRR